MADDMMNRALSEFGLEVETTAEDALLNCLYRAHGTVMFYRHQVRLLSKDQMVYGTESIKRTIRPIAPALQAGGPTHTQEDTTIAKPIVNIWVRLLQDAEKHLLAVASKVAELNIEHRRVALAEEQGAFMFKLLQVVVRKLGMDPEDERLPTIIPEAIEELTSGELDAA